MSRSFKITKDIQKLVKKIVKQLSGDPILEEELEPEYSLSGVGHIHCYQPIDRTFARIARGQKIFLLSEVNFENKVLVYTNCGRVVIIDYDEIYFTEFD
tara:strand:+ start:2028 stop:2324 length:297 start_codon:yes stop_codon:yes gene_type:complete